MPAVGIIGSLNIRVLTQLRLELFRVQLLLYNWMSTQSICTCCSAGVAIYCALPAVRALYNIYIYIFFGGNGQKRELPVHFGQKRMYPKHNSGKEGCRPYLIGQHPRSPVFGQKRPGTPGNSYFAQLPPVFGQKRPGTPGNSYFAQLPPVFGHFMFLSGGLLECSNRSTWFTRTRNSKISTR